MDLDRIGRLGVDRLRKATPVDTGALQDGWRYKVVNDTILFWNENNEDGIVRFLTNGHLTTAGTWVAGNDFVTPILKEIQNEIRRETQVNGRRVLRRQRKRVRVV